MEISAAALDQFNQQVEELIEPTAPRTVENEAGEQIVSREYRERGLDRYRVFDGHRQCAYYEPLRLNVQWSPGVELQQRAATAPQFFNVLDEYERLTNLVAKLKDQVIKYKLDVLFQFKEFDAREFQRMAQRLEKLKDKITALVLYIIQQRMPRTPSQSVPASYTSASASASSVRSTEASSVRSTEASSVGSIADFVESDTEGEPPVPLRELMRQTDSSSSSPSSPSSGSLPEPQPASSAPVVTTYSLDELIESINDLLVKIKNMAKTELDDQGIAELLELQNERREALHQLMLRKYKFNHVETPNGWFKIPTTSAEEEQRVISQQLAMQTEAGYTEDADEAAGEDIFAADSPVGGAKSLQHGGYAIKVDGKLAQQSGCDARINYEDVNLQYAWVPQSRYAYTLKQQPFTLRNFIVEVKK